MNNMINKYFLNMNLMAKMNHRKKIQDKQTNTNGNYPITINNKLKSK